MTERPTKRSYDATRRRERAEEERSETRAKVLAAATALFVERGYTATTIADIAARAGVAVQSVYSSAGGKPDLVQAVMDRAVAGDEPAEVQEERLAEISAAPTPEQLVRRMASTISAIVESTAPVQRAYREAAATEPSLAPSLAAAKRERYEAIGLALRTLPEQALRGGYEEATLTAWSIVSFEVFLLHTDTLGRDPARVRTWLADTLVAAVLAPGAQPDQ